MAVAAGKQMADVKHPAHPRVPSPLVLWLRGGTHTGAGVRGAARATGPAGTCPGAGAAAVPCVGLWGSCSELQAPSSASSSRPALLCPSASSCLSLESLFPWKAPSLGKHLPIPFHSGTEDGLEQGLLYIWELHPIPQALGWRMQSCQLLIGLSVPLALKQKYLQLKIFGKIS